MEAQLKALVRQREAVRGKLLRMRAALKDSEEEPNANVRNVHFLQLKKKALENIYRECNEVQNKIYALPLSEDEDEVQSDKYVEFEGIFNEVFLTLSMLIEVVPKVEPVASAVGQPAQQPAHPFLPPLQVPLPKLVPSAKPKSAGKSHTLMVSESKNEQKCPVCKAAHKLGKCDGFKCKSVSEKYEILKRSGCCFNCLMRGHRTRACSSGSCHHCGKKHHTLLHEDSPSQVVNSAAQPTMPVEPKPGSSQTASAPARTSTTLCASAASSEKQTVLSTAVVLIDGRCSTPLSCRVILDSASQMNFVTERFANLLSLKLAPADFTVSGLNGNKTRISRKLRTTIRSRHGDFAAELDLLVTPRITGELPVKFFNALEWPISSELMLADPTFNKRGRVDMLIGAEYFWNLLLDGRRELGPDRPVLRNTKLGWIAGGVIASDAMVVARTFCQTSDEEPLIELLKSFYKVEACDENRPSPTADDDMSLEHFQRTHERTEEGRYVVRHPFNERKRELGDSREMALRRFLAQERKLDKQPELTEQYSQFIREYEQLGHMREIDEAPNEDPGSVFYLPHHCVLRPTSTTNKLRVVFDGSAKTSTGASINDVLRTGPTIQNDLTTILLRFRGFQNVFTLDIPKMFRQVRVHPEDTRYQRIFWRYDRNDFVTVRELLTVTYGLGPSPFQATMALKQAAVDHEDEFPRAAEVVEKGTYMDDILTGPDTLAEACQLQREETGLLAKACFGAHKWCANHSDIVREIPEDQRGNSFEVTDDSSKTTVKTLGVTCNPFDDWFSVSVPDSDNIEEVTRRKLLSQLAKILDPLGFFGPVITYTKLILREVGELQIEWDDPVPTDIAKKWRSFRIKMKALREVRLPRRFSWKGALKLELHRFADASDLAYSACLYVQGFFANEETEIQLICSKSRILPKKRKPPENAIWTPRTELLAALLLARMVVKFVSNRESEIQRLTQNFHWNCVATHENLADSISREVTPKKLIKSKKLWRGRPRPLVAEAAEAIEIPDDELPDILALMDGADTNHRLNGLEPFLDGLLRAGGRIKRAIVLYDSRHLMLLPVKHPITEALVRELLVDQNAPPLQWPLGRIVTAHPEDDGVTRVVTVRMTNGAELKHAVNEVCLLPLDADED